jgi:hypothetical protein
MPLAQLADPWRKMNTTPISEVCLNSIAHSVVDNDLNKPGQSGAAVELISHNFCFFLHRLATKL